MAEGPKAKASAISATTAPMTSPKRRYETSSQAGVAGQWPVPPARPGAHVGILVRWSDAGQAMTSTSSLAAASLIVVYAGYRW